MTTDRQKAVHQNSPKQFIESFEDFCVGVVDLERIRALIADQLQSDRNSGESMLETIDAAFREGLIKASTYELLITDIDRATSEDEPTEWSEEILEQYDEALESSLISPNDETGHPVEKPEAIPAGTTRIEIKPGDTLKNRFELVTRIGGGNMADVYEAIDRRKQEAGSTDPRLAIKVISGAFSKHTNALETLQREALNSQGLVHPNIIRVFDFDRDDDRFFMTMELLDGQSLVEMLDKIRFRPLPLSQAVSIINGVCAGLQHAHEQGIIHADIKPGNIFVTAANQVKILDFGIARVSSENIENDNSPVIGAHTPAYASCEVLESAEPTVQDDLFALGCVAYRMLSGRRAFGGLTALDAESRHIEPQRLEMLTPEQWQALKNLLAFRRIDRTATVGDFTTAFSGLSPNFQPADKPTAGTAAGSISNGLPLRFGIPAIAVLLIAITLALFWPEPDPLPTPRLDPLGTSPSDPPANTAQLPGSEAVRPLIENAESIAAEEAEKPLTVTRVEPEIATADPITNPRRATPKQPKPQTSRIDELTALADQAMNEGHLLEPPEDNAHLYVVELTTLAPEKSEVRQRKTRLTELMLLEAMVAITDEKFDVATRWISETRALGVPAETLQRFEAELQKARDAQKVRQTEKLGSIFASATPAAILATPGIDFSDEDATATEPEILTAYPDTKAEPMTGPGSLSLTMILPGALQNGSQKATNKVPTGEVAETATQDIALSALEFSRYVEPKLPRHNASNRTEGWVELRFRVTANGRTDDIRVTNAEPEGVFEDSAITAVSKWRFKPVYIDGIAAEKYSSVRLRFTSR